MEIIYHAKLTAHGFTRSAGSDYHYDDGETVLCVGPKQIWNAYDFDGNRTTRVDYECARLHRAGVPIAKHLLFKDAASCPNTPLF